MKKVLPIVLATSLILSMSAMPTMAADMTLELVVDTGCGDELGWDDQMLPGNEYHFDLADYGFQMWWDDSTSDPVELDTSNFRVSTDWDTGSALVKSVKIDNDCNHLVITLNENYTISEAKDLEGTITLELRDDMYGGTGDLYEDGDEFDFSFTAEVCNNLDDSVDGGDSRDDATEIDVEDNTIYQMSSSGWVEFCGDGNRLSSVKARLAEDKKVFAYFNEDPVDEIEDMYYDLDADINYINFVGSPSLGSNATVAIQGDYSDQYYLYEYTGGQLEEIDADWNDDDGTYEFTTSRLGTYVLSDTALVAEADEEEEEEVVDEVVEDEETTDDTSTQNPDTGANDAIGVAVALAAVSLVAAGAVSLKK